DGVPSRKSPVGKLSRAAGRWRVSFSLMPIVPLTVSNGPKGVLVAPVSPDELDPFWWQGAATCQSRDGDLAIACPGCDGPSEECCATEEKEFHRSPAVRIRHRMTRSALAAQASS